MSETHENSRQFGILQLLGYMALACSTGASVAWLVGRDRIEKELSLVKQTNDWKLPETLKAMGELSPKIKLDAEQRLEFERLRSQKIAYDDKKRDFDKQLAELNAQIAPLKSKLESYEGESFVLRTGESHFLIPKVLAVGLKSCDGFSNEAEVQFGSETRKLKPGMAIEAASDGKNYRVFLQKIEDKPLSRDDSATFTVGEPEEVEYIKDKLEKAKHDFDKQIAALNEQFVITKTKLESYEGETFDLQKGESHFVIPKVLAIGLADFDSYFNNVEVQFGKESRKLKPGMPIEVTFEGKAYRVILRKINNQSRDKQSATFSISEAKEFKIEE
jgi:bifunctional DNA-binding transcriptional regulator/antitoxin component of YhaV-PrlF toxin-antitoxin module